MTLYVAAGGSDGNACTGSDAPCATISHALTQAASGATVYVSGTITDNVTISDNVTITGAGAATPPVVNGGDSDSVFTIDTSGITVAVEDLTVTGGSSAHGGGIYNDATLTVADSTIEGNNATNGGGIYNDGGSTAVVTDSTVEGNDAFGGGGENHLSGVGGGIYNDGTLTASNSTIVGNSAATGGVGIYNVSGSVVVAGSILATLGGPPAVGECGGTITDGGGDVVDDSSCGFAPSAVSIGAEDLVTLSDNGGLTETMLPETGNPAIGLISPDATYTPADSLSPVPTCPQADQRGVITPNGQNCSAGSVQVASILYVAQGGSDAATCTASDAPCATISHALTLAASGATVYVSGTITDNVVITNSVTITGAGAALPAVVDGSSSISNETTVLSIYSPGITVNVDDLTVTGGAAAFGGGIANSAMLNLTDSTIESNNASTEGGGIYNDIGSTAFVTDTTIEGNSATAEGGEHHLSGAGGGIFNAGTLTVSNSTLEGNSAVSGGVGIYANGGTTVVAGSILATVGGPPSTGECDGTDITDGGGNVTDDATCGFAPSANSAAAEDLGPLGNNGGPTQTMVPETGNPAIGLISPSATYTPAGGHGAPPICPQADQRGATTPSDQNCTAGSVQLAVTTTTATSPGTITFSSSAAQPVTVSATVTSGGLTVNEGDVTFTLLDATSTTVGTALTVAVNAGAASGSYVVPAGTAVGTYTLDAAYHDSAAHDATSADDTQSLMVTAPVVPVPPVPPTLSHGYWLVGANGEILTYGSAPFEGSTAGLALNRPIVGIVPTPDHGGYWLDASDGGVFSFGDTTFYGSIPGLGLHPAGSGIARSLNAPIVGMVPSHDDGGYFMVGADGGVFAFGDATFEGSCPELANGCAGPAVGVAADASGKGYWLVTTDGDVYTFGDAPYLGAPGPQSSAITDIVATPDGGGYWILDANGGVFSFGDATPLGAVPLDQAGGLEPATAIFPTADGAGFWVVNAVGRVFAFGDAPIETGPSSVHPDSSIIAGRGF